MKKTVIAFTMTMFAASLASAGDFSGKGITPLAPPVCDDCLSYDFVDLEYGILDFGNDFADEGDLYGIGFSKSLGTNLFLTGGYANGGYDYDWGAELLDVSTHRYRLGLGARVSLAKCVDLTFEGGAEHTDAEYEHNTHLDYDSWAYYVGPGVRARAGRLEVFAKALFVSREGDLSQQYLSMMTTDHLGIDEDGWIFNPGLIFHFTDQLGLKLAGEFGENDNLVTGGVRFEF